MSGRATPEVRPTAIGKEQASRNARQLFDKERGDDKEYIHLVVIGHVDAGKSTLMGHTLFDLGDVPQRVMHKYEQESRKLGKQSFMYAWVLDETGEERERGITMDVGSTRFSTKTKIVRSYPYSPLKIQIHNYIIYPGDPVGRARPQRLHPKHDFGRHPGGRGAARGRRHAR